MTKKATCFIFVSFLLCPVLMAQRTTGTILGTVSDATGAVIPGAEITVTHADTGLSRTAVSDDLGAYVMSSLPPGLYRLQVSLAGFKEAVLENVRLNVDQQRRADLLLEVGEITEQVMVQAKAVPLGTANPSMGEVITGQQVVELPLNGRGYIALAALGAGVTVPDGLVQGSSVTGRFAGGRPSSVAISGQRDYNTEFRFDGIPSKDRVYGPVGIQFNVDAIEEFNVQRGYTDTEFGLSGRINVVTKSGTNRFHGSLYEFHRNRVLDARNFFASERLPFVRNHYGVTGGGAILKDKLFFFGEWEGLRRRQTLPLVASVPETQWYEGNFSNLEIPITDPLTGEQFAGNIIPSSRFSRFANTLIPFLRQASPNATGANNYVAGESTFQDDDKWTIRMDWTLSEKDTFFGRLTWMDSATGRAGLIPESGRSEPLKGRNAVLSWTHTFTPNLLHDAKVGLNRTINVSFGPALIEEPNFQELFELENISNVAQCNALPGIDLSGIASYGVGACIPLWTNDLHYIYNLSYNRGRHRIKAGAEVTRTFLRQLGLISHEGFFRFSGEATGHPVGDMILGNPLVARGQFRSVIPDRRSWFQSYYINDEFQVTPKLTLTLGLRYDNFGSWAEDNHKIGTFDRENPAGGFVYPPGCMFRGESCGDLPFSRILEGGVGLRFRDDNNWAPRIGLAYSPGPNTAIRASFGLFYQGLTGNELDFNTSVFPFVLDHDLGSEFGNIVDGVFVPGNLVELDNDQIFPVPSGGRTGGAATRGFNWAGPNGYLQNWTVSVQQSLPYDLFFEAAYVGSKGTSLDKREDINTAQTPPPPGFVGDLQSRRPFPDFSWILDTDMDANSWYHSMQLTLKRSVGRGLTFLGSYTFSKSLDESSFEGQARSTGLHLPGKARSTFDNRQRATFSFVYSLPGGNSDNAAAKALLSGWQLTGITTLSTGFPFHPSTNTDYSRRSSIFANLPNRVCDGTLPSNQRTVQRWFDTSCFQLPESTLLGDPVDTIGNSGFHFLDLDGIINQDVGFYRNFTFREPLSLQFRAEFFNIFNQPNFGRLGTRVEAVTYGVVNRATAARIIQFGLKLRW